jgi:hypothetical protein
MHPMLNIAVKAARRAGSIIERSAVSGVALDVRAKRTKRFRHAGRSRRRAGGDRCGAQGLSGSRDPR